MKVNIGKIIFDTWLFLATLFVIFALCCLGYIGFSLLTIKESDIQKNEEILLKLNAAYFNASQTNWNIIIVPRTNN